VAVQCSCCAPATEEHELLLHSQCLNYLNYLNCLNCLKPLALLVTGPQTDQGGLAGLPHLLCLSAPVVVCPRQQQQQQQQWQVAHCQPAAAGDVRHCIETVQDHHPPYHKQLVMYVLMIGLLHLAASIARHKQGEWWLTCLMLH
jgi:hypothetical protein